MSSKSKEFTSALPSAILAAFCAACAGPAHAGSTNQPSSAEILVVATRTPKSAFDAPAAVDVINRDDLRKLAPSGLDEALQPLTGTSVQGGGFPGNPVRFSLRGLTYGYQSRNVLVLQDGRRVNDEYVSNVEFNLLPLDGIQRIEVLKGPASALYGSGAVGGVLSIETRTGATSPGTDAEIWAGSHDTFRAAAAHGGKSGSCDYFAAASRVATDGYTTNSDGTARDWSAANIMGNIGWHPAENQQLRLHLGRYRGQGTDEASERTADRDYQALVYSSRWGGEKYPQTRINLYRKGSRDEYDWKYPDRGLYRQQTLAAEAQHSLWLSEDHLLISGMEYRREGVDIDEVAGPLVKSAATAAAFVQDEWSPLAVLRITLGLRADYNQGYGAELSPRVGLVWKPADSSKLYVSAHRAHRAPALSDKHANVEYMGMRFEGNPELEPERVTTVEIGANHSPAPGVEATLAVFQAAASDAFDFMRDPDGVYRNRNVDDILIRGAETELRLKPARCLAFFANYTFTHGTYDKYPADPSVEGNRLEHLARNQANVGADYIAESGMSCRLALRYSGSRYGDARNTDKMADYTVADWRFETPIIGSTALKIHVGNIFDKRYQNYRGVDQPGRTFNVGLRTVF